MGRNVLLTGGTTGIGKAIAYKILSEAKPEDLLIVVYGHNDAAANDFLEGAMAKFEKTHVELVKCDMSNPAAIEQIRNEVKQRVDALDWIILNTGIGTYLPFEEYDYDLWDKVIRTNVSIPALLVKELKPIVAENGKILFTGSHSGQVPYSSSVVYGVSKAAVHFLAKTLVKVFESKGVCINAIAPGFIETRWQDDRTQESRDRINKKIAKHRFGTPEEVAHLSYAILTNDYINGAIYDIHGGYDYF